MDRRGVADLARRWWAAISTNVTVAVSDFEMRRRLAGWIDTLDLALSEPSAASPVERVGVELVRANITNPAVLAPSYRLLAELVSESPHPDRCQRFAGLLGDLTSGFTTELLATRARSQEALQRAITDARHAVEERFRVVFTNAAVSIAVYDMTGTVIDVNPFQARMVGMNRKGMRGVYGLDFIHPDDREGLHVIIRELLEAGHGTVRFESRFCRRDGSVGWGSWAMTMVPSRGDRLPYVLAIGTDTTDLRAMQAELSWQARHDQLTGLANRRCLLERLAAMTATAGPEDRVGLCFVDLDGFKQVNDRYGHSAGDHVLAEVAHRLDAALDGMAAMLARIGGDEFVALLGPPCGDTVVGAAAEAMMQAFREPFPVGGTERLSMSAGIGAVATAVAGIGAEALLDEADMGLYKAKADGPGTWVLHRADEAAGRGRSPR